MQPQAAQQSEAYSWIFLLVSLPIPAQVPVQLSQEFPVLFQLPDFPDTVPPHPHHQAEKIGFIHLIEEMYGLFSFIVTVNNQVK